MRCNVSLGCFIAFWALHMIATVPSTDTSPDVFLCWLQDFNVGPQGTWRERRRREPLHRTFSDLFYASSEHRPARGTSPMLIQRLRALKEATSGFQCSECAKSFVRVSALEQHKRSHQADRTVAQSDAAPENGAVCEKDGRDTICSKSFSS